MQFDQKGMIPMILKRLQLHSFRVVARYLFWQIAECPTDRIVNHIGSFKLVVYYFRGIPSFAIHQQLSSTMMAYEVYPISGELKCIYRGKYPIHPMNHNDKPIK